MRDVTRRRVILRYINYAQTYTEKDKKRAEKLQPVLVLLSQRGEMLNKRLCSLNDGDNKLLGRGANLQLAIVFNLGSYCLLK